jgi:dephospho-CoA kinase
VILRVGLTGGIASGKSTILKMFAELGCLVTDADAIVARLYQPGAAGHEALVRTYGPSILRADETIDRPRLAQIAFSSAEESRRLNELIHPLVLAEEGRMMDEASARDEDVIYIVEATLLLESGGRSRYDRIVVVDVRPDVQLDRGIGRGMAPDEVARRVAHQMPREERLRHADYVIENNGDRDEALVNTREVHRSLLADLAEKKKSLEFPRGS